MTSFKPYRTLVLVLAGSILGACGGGGGSSSPPAPSAPPPVTSTSDFDRGIFSDPTVYKDLCQNPRGAGSGDLQGTTTDENDWLRTWSNDLYLWYDEIVDEDPEDFQTLPYFDLMRTFATTASGADRDKFHFTFDTEAWERLSQQGVSAGYGLEFSVERSTPPREVIVAFVEPGSPAANANVSRGERIVELDGFDVVNDSSSAAVDAINAALIPSAANEQHSFGLESQDGTSTRTVSLTSAEVTADPVPTVEVFNTSAGPVGYMLFNTHIATAEERLVFAINALAAQNVTELVLDLRYNGGGFLDIANELAFMVAGPSAAQGRIFDEIIFNDKHPTTNPVTGRALVPDTFHTTTQGFTVSSGQALPSLNLPRVFVLSGPGTCSASESIINGLRGIDVEVVLIGETTCGKPYGFFPFDNCGTTYFTIQFSGSNNKGFGDFSDGFTPVPGGDPGNPAAVAGCVVADDFSSPLGDVNEARLAAALTYIETGNCPTAGIQNSNKAIATSKSLPAASASASAINVGKPGMPGLIKRR